MSSTCPPAEALSAERLAAWVDASCERADALLFTASAREDLDGIATWQRLSDLAFAGQCRSIVATWDRAGVTATLPLNVGACSNRLKLVGDRPTGSAGGRAARRTQPDCLCGHASLPSKLSDLRSSVGS